MSVGAWLAVCNLMLWAGQLVDGHVHAAPHGGKIVHLGAQHLELRVGEKQIEAWILDHKLRTVLPREMPGGALKLTLVPQGDKLSKTEKAARKPQTVAMTPEDDHFRAAVDLLGLPQLTVTAELESAGRTTVRKTFTWTPLDARDRLNDIAPLEGLKPP
jgi:hypothetical protein